MNRTEIQVPYGKSYLTAFVPDQVPLDWIEPVQVQPAENPKEVVQASLDSPVGKFAWAEFSQSRTVGIAINDKTRPVPHQHLLPPLLERLENLGIPDDAITFYIAVGTHPPMMPDEYPTILPASILSRYKVESHDSEAEARMIHLGSTRRGTPVWVNHNYYRSDFKIVLGNIEPHQFMGFSGGVKTAAVGLAGLKTINKNHAMMVHPDSQLGTYEINPARQDVEEIGRMIGVHLAVNAILTQDKKVIYALAGNPRSVMMSGIPLARRVCQVPVRKKYRMMIVSPGGHPKDLNVYQAQKGMYHASRIMEPGGILILVAACPEGSGSLHYEDWMVGKRSNDQVLRDFKKQGFRIGPHKAYLIARDASRLRLLFCSEIDKRTAEHLLLNQVDDFQEAVDQMVADLNPGERIGVLPHASSTIPFLDAVVEG